MSKTIDEMLDLFADQQIFWADGSGGSHTDFDKDDFKQSLREAIGSAKPAEQHNATSDQYDAGTVDGYNQAIDDYTKALFRELGIDKEANEQDD